MYFHIHLFEMSLFMWLKDFINVWFIYQTDRSHVALFFQNVKIYIFHLQYQSSRCKTRQIIYFLNFCFRYHYIFLIDRTVYHVNILVAKTNEINEIINWDVFILTKSFEHLWIFQVAKFLCISLHHPCLYFQDLFQRVTFTI